MTMHWIASVSGNGSSGTIQINNIPSTFTHLHLRGSVRSTTTSSQLYIRLNGDSGGNYATHYVYGTGSGVVGGTGGTSGTVHLLGELPASTSLANTSSVFYADLLDYTDTTKYKTIKGSSGYDLNGSGTVWFTSSVWMNTAAVTSIQIPANSAFDTNSRFDLYGIISNPLATGA
jgi:hypothetical protein